MNGIGSRIRGARASQHKSLSDVAARAKISAATLSRIETEKQGVGITMLLLLAKVLKVHPNDLLGEPEWDERNDPIAQKLASMNVSERTQLWMDLSTIRRDGRGSRKREATPAAIGAQIEELLAQIDYLRQEVDSMRTHLTRRPRVRR